MLLSLCALIMHAQPRKSNFAVAGQSSKTTVIGGQKVSGSKYFDEELLLSLTGLSVGDPINVEGDEKVAKAIQNLWKQGFFSNIEVRVDKIIDNKVFLDFNVTERPRLSKYNFKGIKQSEANDLKDKLTLAKNKVITDAMRVNAINAIKKFYYEKGYLNTEVVLSEKKDTLIENTKVITFAIDKGVKTKVSQINIVGNENAGYIKLKGRMKGSKEMARFSLHPISNESRLGSQRVTFKDYINAKGFLSLSKTMEYLDPYFRYKFFTASKFNDKKYADDKDAVVDYYNSLGYRDAYIEKDSLYKTREGYLNIDVKVNEGNKYYFGDIAWKGNTKYTDSFLNKLLAIKKGDVFNQELLERRLGKIPSADGGDDITSLYMDDGYLYFNIDPQETSVFNDTINFEMRMTEGTQATIRNIIITGNDKTHEHVIRREIRTLPGNKFSRTDLIRTNRELATLGYFDAEKIGMVPKPNADGTVDIEYSVVEKSSDQLELQAGFGGALGLTGTLGVTFNNLSFRNFGKKSAYDPLPMGDGQKLSIRGQANGRWFNSLNVSFTEPWLGGKKPTALQVGLFRNYFSSNFGAAREVDTSSMSTIGISANIIKRLKWPDDNFNLTYGFNYQLYQLKKSELGRAANLRTGNAHNFHFRIALSRYTIDQPLYPRSGSNINLTAMLTPPYSVFDKKLVIGQDDGTGRVPTTRQIRWIEYQKYRFTAEWYHNPKGNLVLKFATKHGYLGNYTPGLTSPFERFQLGGNALQGFQLFGKDFISQRGYEVYQQDAIIFNKYTFEARYPFSLNPSSTIYGLAFADAANAWNSYRDFNPFKLNRDAGIGIRIFLPMFGMLGLDYGMRFDSNPQNAINNSNPFKNTNITFMLGVEPD